MTKRTPDPSDPRVTFREFWDWTQQSSLRDLARLVPRPCGGRAILFNIPGRPVTVCFDRHGYIVGHE
jgi:hypothetical protein